MTWSKYQHNPSSIKRSLAEAKKKVSEAKMVIKSSGLSGEEKRHLLSSFNTADKMLNSYHNIYKQH